jgi:hypothetical protein
MNWNGWHWVALTLKVLFFVGLGFIIMFDQYRTIGEWFQFTDLHHETFALVSFAVAAGIVIGSTSRK